MGILNLIATTSAEVAFTCSPQDATPAAQCNNLPTSWLDLGVTFVICLTVGVCVFIVAYYVKKIISAQQNKNQDNNPAKDNPEKSEEERKDLKEKERYDAAWRFIKMCWNVSYPEMVKDSNGLPVSVDTGHTLTEKDLDKYEEAWSVVRKYIGAEKIYSDHKK